VTITEQRQHPDEEQQDQRQAFFRLMLVLLAGGLAAYSLGIAKATAVVFAVIVMIMLHELGHFATAKWAGMKVTEYFVGFGPRLWSVRKGETEYGVKALPLGGYVKIIGMTNLEDVDPVDEPRTYRQQPFLRRLSVAVAGSFMHFVIAFVLLVVLHTTVGLIRYDKDPLPVIGEISRLKTGPSPAVKAGLDVGDKVISVDGKAVGNWRSLRNYIQDHPGQTVHFLILRDGNQLTVDVTPIKQLGQRVDADGDPIGKPEPVGFVGISPAYPVEKDGFAKGVARGVGDLGTFSKETVKALGSMFSFDGMQKYGDQLTSGRGPVEPSEDQPRFLSPVGLARVASQTAESGIRQVLILLVSINIFVGIFNMFPMLPFDGGHVAIAVYEAIRSKIAGRKYHADVTKLLPVTYLVFLGLMFLAVTSLYLDIAKPLNLQ
jgi:membrane-associated protease RseP (regulator of RpoE activity)